MTDILSDEITYTCRNTPFLMGHNEAEQIFLSRTLHETIPHAWLISGVKGIGKATLAFRMARFLLNNEDGGLFGASESLDMDPENPVFRKIVMGSHPDVLVLERGVDRKTGKVARDIVVDDARRIDKFLRLTPAESAYRVVIIDSVDEMNRNAANAILKLLEEPPKGAVIFLVSHAPGRILPTIKSRCCHMRLHPLSDQEVSQVMMKIRPEMSSSELHTLQKFSKGAPGVSLTFYDDKVMDLYQKILVRMMSIPTLNYKDVHELGDMLAAKSPASRWKYGTFLLQHCLNMIIKSSASPEMFQQYSEQEQKMIEALIAYRPVTHWLRVWDEVQELSRGVERINLDPKAVTIQIFAAMQEPAYN